MRFIIILFFILSFCFNFNSGYSQDHTSVAIHYNDTYDDPEDAALGKKINSTVRALRLYHDNYFLFYDAPVKFQFSIQYRMMLPKDSRDETGFYFAYTQKSLWDLWNWSNSAPFLESNYMPEMFYRYDYGNNNPVLKWVSLGLLHESNGMGTKPQGLSKSWNRIYLESKLHFGKNDTFVITPRAWVPFGTEDNSDITHYEGYGDLSFEFNYFNRFYESKIEVKIRKGWDHDWKKYGIEVNKTIGPFVMKSFKTIFPFALYIQLWHGYGETLMQYNKSETKIRAGIGLILN